MADHTCPGGCKKAVPYHLFACRACWFRLPRDLRRPILGNHGRDSQAHAEAMADAFQWYAENPT